MELQTNKKNSISAERRARINRIKKIIVILNFSIMFTAILLCILFVFLFSAKSKEAESIKQELDASQYEKESLEQELINRGEEEKTVIEYTIVDANTSKDDTIESQYEKVVYLTFDDGPSENTQAILDVLDGYGVKATFFVNGREGEKYRQSYKDIVAGGHSIGLHSYTHVFSEVYASLDAFRADTDRLHTYIYEVTGVDTKLYRFPGGSSNSKTDNIKEYITYLESVGYTYYDWNVSSGDAVGKGATAEEIVQNVMNGVNGREKAIVLLHDASEKVSTVEALPTIIEKLMAEGYTILPIVSTTPPVHHTVK